MDSIFEMAFVVTIVFAYLSLICELTMLHVPSVASSLNIWRPDNNILRYYSDKFIRIFQYPYWLKVLLFIIPVVVIYIVYVMPFILIWLSDLGGLLYGANILIYSLAIGLIVLGRYITLDSVFTIRKENKQEGDSFKLHDDGSFSKMRNPGLVGLYIFLFGIWVALPNLLFLIGIVFYMSYMHFKVTMEEDFLGNRYGDSYTQYFLQTKRYL